jgi:FkbM family methyltransferase
MTSSLLRLLSFAQRFVIGAHNFGLLGALKVLWFYRVRIPAQPASIWLKRPRQRFHFRGAADKGVMSHFCKEGYRIRDGQTAERVRFIVDAGANIGDETTRFRFFHPDATIVALEPEPGNFRLLERNTQASSQTIALNKGLWSRECRLAIQPGTSNESFKVTEVHDPAAAHDVVATSVPDLMRQFGVAEIDILKLDVEGAEREIFAAQDADWIAKVKVFIFECPDNDAPGTTQVIFDALRRTGRVYDCQLHGENIVLIRRGVPWTLDRDVFFER